MMKLLVDDAGTPTVFLNSYFYQRPISEKKVDRYFKTKHIKSTSKSTSTSPYMLKRPLEFE